MKTFRVCILALGCLATASMPAQTASPAPAPPPAPLAAAPAPPDKAADPALGSKPGKPNPDPVVLAKDLLEHKKYQDVLNLVGALNGQLTALAQSNDSLYARTLMLNLQMSTMQENSLSSQAQQLREDTQAADQTRERIISAIEETAPGMKWDRRLNKLVPAPPPLPLPPAVPRNAGMKTPAFPLPVSAPTPEMTPVPAAKPTPEAVKK